MIIRPKIYGLCSGAKRSLELAIKQDKNTVIYKELLHNKEIIKFLDDNGIKTVNTIPKDKKVLIRAHGEPKSTYDYLIDNNIEYIDATCPNVLKVQEIINKHYKDGFNIIIIGKKDHPEVIAHNGWCNNTAVIVETKEDIPLINKKTLIVCQTTTSKELANNLMNLMECEYTKVINTICNAQLLIQEEAIKLSKNVDLMIVVGGTNSSNTKELFRLCSNITNAVMISDIEEAKTLKINNDTIVGITGGASTPITLIDKIADIIENK